MSILNLGSLNLDRTYLVPHFVAPGETISAEHYSTACGGKGLNQSIALARAGERVFHAGAIGEDGEPLRALLEAAGVELCFLEKTPGPSGHAIIQLTPTGENSIIVYGGANSAVTPETVDRALEHFGPGDILLLQNETSCVDYAIRQAKKRAMQVAFNPSPVSDALLHYPLELVDLFILNEVEGAALGGGTDDAAILAGLKTRFPRAAFVLTVGCGGAYYQKGDLLLHQDIYAVSVADTTAAGDTFCGYFLACTSRGCTPAQALDLASRASALAVSRKGAACSIPCWKEVAEFACLQPIKTF